MTEYCYGFEIYGHVWISAKDQAEAHRKFLAMPAAKLADEGGIDEVEHLELQDDRPE